MFETRNRRILWYFVLATVGGAAIALGPIFAIVFAGRGLPFGLRLVAGTIAIALSMAWACYFAFRAHLAEDEFQRHREITTWFWGGWMGIGASAPVFFFIAMGGLQWIGAEPPGNLRLLHAFVLGYLLPFAGAVTGVAIMSIWRRVRDAQAS